MTPVLIIIAGKPGVGNAWEAPEKELLLNEHHFPLIFELQQIT